MQGVIADAEARYRQRDYAGAAALLEQVSNPPPAALALLGLCRLRQGAPDAALALLAQAHAVAPGDGSTTLHYGVALQAAGQHHQALPLFRMALAALPGDAAPALNLSASLLALGDAQAALAAARKGRLRAPALPASHYTVGRAYLGVGFLAQAKASFRRAIDLAPGFADAWLNLGVAQYRDGEIEMAKQAMHTVLALQPGHPAAIANLAVFLRLTGAPEAAETLLQQAIHAGSDPAPASINLAADLLREERPADALAALSGPLPPPGPMRQHWQLQQSLALINLGRLAEARAVLDALGKLPDALAPLLQWRLTLLAAAFGDPIAAEERAGAMEHALATTDATLPEHRIMGHYDLARFWSGRLDRDRAFAHWTAGHRHLARFQPFSRAAFAAFVDASIAAFGAARLADGPRASNQDPAPVFIVGMPRSGTTLIEQILHAHAAVYGAGERAALGEVYHSLGGATETPAAAQRIAALGTAALDAQAAGYLAGLHRLDPAASRIVDKMPGNFRHLGLVALLLPGARVIACDRDPRDIGLSIFTYRFFGVHAYANDLADLGWYIGQQRRLMAHWRATLPNPMLTVALKDWVEDFDATLRKVLDFLGLPYDPNCALFHRLSRRVRTVSRAQVQEKVNARGIGRWRSYERQLEPLIAALQQAGALDGVGS